MALDRHPRRRPGAARLGGDERRNRHRPRRRALRGAAARPPALASPDRARRAAPAPALAASGLRRSGAGRRAHVWHRLHRLRRHRYLGARAHAPALPDRGGTRAARRRSAARVSPHRHSRAPRRPRRAGGPGAGRVGGGVLRLASRDPGRPAPRHQAVSCGGARRPGRSGAARDGGGRPPGGAPGAAQPSAPRRPFGPGHALARPRAAAMDRARVALRGRRRHSRHAAALAAALPGEVVDPGRRHRGGGGIQRRRRLDAGGVAARGGVPPARLRAGEPTAALPQRGGRSLLPAGGRRRPALRGHRRCGGARHRRAARPRAGSIRAG